MTLWLILHHQFQLLNIKVQYHLQLIRVSLPVIILVMFSTMSGLNLIALELLPLWPFKVVSYVCDLSYGCIHKYLKELMNLNANFQRHYMCSTCCPNFSCCHNTNKFTVLLNEVSQTMQCKMIARSGVPSQHHEAVLSHIIWWHHMLWLGELMNWPSAKCLQNDRVGAHTISHLIVALWFPTFYLLQGITTRCSHFCHPFFLIFSSY